MKKKLFGGFFLLFTISYLSAQVKDAQLWENIGLEKNITPKLLVRVVQEARLTENFTRPSYNYFDMGFSYKLNKHIHFTFAYVWAEKKVVTDFWMPRHQLYGDITLKGKLHNFTFLDREMLQWQVKDGGRAADGGIPDYYLRSKVTIRYDKSFKWVPYIAAELNYKINSIDYPIYRFDRMRYFAGLFYRTDKENEFEAYYLIEDHLNVKNPQTNFVIGLGYTHSF